MCGAFKIINDQWVNILTDYFDVPNVKPQGWANCGSKIEMIYNDGELNHLQEAIWWLLLDKKNGEYKPSKYTSFNSRWRQDSGFSRSNQKPFRKTRCIIPARGFVEGMNKKYHYLEPVDQAIAFGGLYKTWESGPDEKIFSCSIITIDAHPKFENIHKKAMPLMLPLEDIDLLDAWLDPGMEDTDMFISDFKPVLNADFEITPLVKWRSFEAAGDSFIIPAD